MAYSTDLRKRVLDFIHIGGKKPKLPGVLPCIDQRFKGGYPLKTFLQQKKTRAQKNESD